VDELAPKGVAEGVDEFLVLELHGLDEDLAEIGEGAGLPGLDVALGDGSEQAAEGQAEITGGEIAGGKKLGDFATDLIASAGLGFFAGVEVTELRIAGAARSAAAAAVGEGEGTQRDAVVLRRDRRGAGFMDRRHGISPEMLDLGF
jgi:hypothetical protein